MAADEADGEKAAARGPMTETTVRQFDADGDLVTETVTTVVQVDVKADVPWPGQYL